MFESDIEMRDRLSRTWKTLMERLTDSDFPAYIVYDTLAEVAFEGMVKEHGIVGASQLLRLKVDAIEISERDRMLDLIGGEKAAHPVSTTQRAL